MRKPGVDPAGVFFCPLFWADVLEGPEKELWDKEAASGTLAWTKLRYFVLHNLADAVAYRREPGKQTASKYNEIQTRIRSGLHDAGVSAGDETLPVVVLAHSLGGAIMSDYIWDRQRRPEPTDALMKRLVNLVGMVTFRLQHPAVHARAAKGPADSAAIKRSRRAVRSRGPSHRVAQRLRQGRRSRLAVGEGVWSAGRWEGGSHCHPPRDRCRRPNDVVESDVPR